MRLRLTLGANGELADRNGTVIGELESVTVNFDLQAIRAISEPYGGTTGGKDVDLSLEKVKDTPLPPAENSQESFLPDPVNETWNVYVEALERPRAVLTPKVRKWIRDAHEAVGVDATRDAIRGLAASQYHRDNHYTGIEYAIVPKRGETIEGRVEKMAGRVLANASSSGAVLTGRQFIDHFPVEHRSAVERDIVRPITMMLAEPDNEERRLEGRRRVKQVEGYGFEVVIEDNRITGYRKK